MIIKEKKMMLILMQGLCKIYLTIYRIANIPKRQLSGKSYHESDSFGVSGLTGSCLRYVFIILTIY